MLKDSLDCSDSVRSKLQKHWIKSRCDNKSLLYGRGAKAIAREVSKSPDVNLSVEEAQEFMDKFMLQFPKVALMIARTHEQVEHRGWVETLWGRRAFYPSMQGLANSKRLLAGQKRKGFNFLYPYMEEVKLGEFGEPPLTKASTYSTMYCRRCRETPSQASRETAGRCRDYRTSPDRWAVIPARAPRRKCFRMR